MLKAREADPTNLEVLLSLGVSHTNELEQQEALGYLRSWLQNHPRYGKLVPQDGSAEGLGHEEVRSRSFPGLRKGLGLNLRIGKGCVYPKPQAKRVPLHSQVVSMFRAAVREAPEDADLHTVLGVLLYLSREYDQNISRTDPAL